MSWRARAWSLTPGSSTRMRFVPCLTTVVSATPNWSMRLRIVSSPWSTAKVRMRSASAARISMRISSAASRATVNVGYSASSSRSFSRGLSGEGAITTATSPSRRTDPTA